MTDAPFADVARSIQVPTQRLRFLNHATRAMDQPYVLKLT